MTKNECNAFQISSAVGACSVFGSLLREHLRRNDADYSKGVKVRSTSFALLACLDRELI